MKPSHFMILCIAVLSALVGGTVYVRHPRFGFFTRCSASIPEIMIGNTLRTALLRYTIEHERFPTTAEGLQALLTAPTGETRWRGPYLDLGAGPSQSIIDPWHRPYRYVSPGVKNPDSYDLWSEGPDPHTENDDIVNWPR